MTPLAEAGGAVYVPWLDVCFKGSATGPAAGGPETATGGLAAVDAATGAIVWGRTFPAVDSGAATVADDVVSRAPTSATKATRGEILAYSLP